MANQRLFEIVARVFDIPVESVTEGLSRENTETWDSFNHLLLVSAIEKEMGVKFTMAQIGQIKTARDIVMLIDRNKP